jgi:hypothetical protein
MSKADRKLRGVGRASAEMTLTEQEAREATTLLLLWLRDVDTALGEINEKGAGPLHSMKNRGDAVIRETSELYRQIGRRGAPLEVVHKLRDAPREAREGYTVLEAALRLVVEERDSTGGDVTLIAGNAAGAGSGGNISLRGGTGNG